ncbi:MAG: CGNR zinc finger domain-containing protein [Woeseiaceae bacterium]
MNPPNRPLFLGSHPAIDFLNTALVPDGQRIETIGDGRAFLDWLVGAGLLEDAAAAEMRRQLSGKGLHAVAAEARRLREWARAWLERWRAAPEADYGDELDVLNKLLAREVCYHEVIATGKGSRIVERRRIERADALLALVAMQIAALVTQEQGALVKHCAGPGCTLWFLDRTKAHRRLFCSAAACGNRAKVAAFRQRQRG